jgi:hypothetical protein
MGERSSVGVGNSFMASPLNKLEEKFEEVR